ncbi:SER1 [Candida pseudojiufengensis]|uniref:SER1 n=1 Tax=Candida pseudojiufengensis TaxID=497109 RepID=UPI002225952B|nr:SER1 [Candida pseudojiufengensis]KAI5966407.1 SER1 [Candida pseudojiufengensis]
MSELKSLKREEPNYFGAGPALLPTDVLTKAAYDLLSYDNDIIGIGEISHRSKPATAVIDDTKQNLRTLMNIPDNYEIFFLQGGGTTAFSVIPYNLFANYAKRTGKKGRAAYAVTGTWSAKAVEEAKRLGFEADVVINTKNSNYGDIPNYTSWEPIKEDTAYLWVCDNETVNGNEFFDTPGEEYLPKNVELVADMSSNILSKKIDVSKYGLIMAGAQKNIGIAGLTIYIIRKDLLDQATDAELRKLDIALVPIAYDFPMVVKNNSAYNTIPLFTCQILKLVTEKLINEQGIANIQKINDKKAKLLYGVLDKYSNFYRLPVTNPKVRSKMNVVFKTPSEDLDAKFVKEAEAANLKGLKGHRSVGGIRASIYNAVSYTSVEKLANFVEEFAKNNT